MRPIGHNIFGVQTDALTEKFSYSGRHFLPMPRIRKNILIRAFDAVHKVQMDTLGVPCGWRRSVEQADYPGTAQPIVPTLPDSWRTNCPRHGLISVPAPPRLRCCSCPSFLPGNTQPPVFGKAPLVISVNTYPPALRVPH